MLLLKPQNFVAIIEIYWCTWDLIIHYSHTKTNHLGYRSIHVATEVLKPVKLFHWSIHEPGLMKSSCEMFQLLYYSMPSSNVFLHNY